MKRLSLLVFLLFSCMAMSIAQRTVTGVVTDLEGEALIGASVIAKGTSVGTITDIDGSFSLSVPEGVQMLEISYTGFESMEVDVSTSSNVTISMAEGALLDEVVVTGYGTAKRSDQVAAISTIKGSEISNIAIASVDNLLQGRSTGVEVTAINGKPGQNAYIRVRGLTSINGNNDPLFIVDGVPVPQSVYAAINPNDIESFNILKDAAALSIYGARASAGVVLIETKKGNTKNSYIEYSNQIGTTRALDDGFDLMNASQKINYEIAAGVRNPQTAAQRAELLRFGTNWEDVLLREAGIQNHNLAFSGGNADGNYYLSVSRADNQGLSVGSDFDRTTAKFNGGYQINDWISVSNTLSLARRNDNELRDRNNVQSPFVALYSYNAYETVYNLDEDGAIQFDEFGEPIYSGTSQGFNIVEAQRNNPESREWTDMFGSLSLTLTPIKNFSFTSRGGYNFNTFKNEYFIKPNSILDGFVGDSDAPGIKRDSGNDRNRYVWANTAQYDLSIDSRSSFNFLVGTEFIKDEFETFSISGKGFPLGLSVQEVAAEITDGFTNKDEFALFSTFGKIGYSFDNALNANVTVRRDGSSRFGENRRYGTFFGVGVGYDLSQGILKNNSTFDQLKVRASYGTTGNEPTNLYDAIATTGFVSYDDQTASLQANVANPDLQWESQVAFNVGVDYGILNNRITGSLEYYTKSSEQLLFPRPISPTTGFDQITDNIGILSNRGLEAEIYYSPVRGDFTLDLGLRFSTNKTRIDDINTDELINPVNAFSSVLQEGEVAYVWELVEFVGIDDQTGDPVYLNANGEETTSPTASDAQIMSGKSALPTYWGGFDINMGYKGLQLTTQFAFKGGNYIYNLRRRNLLGGFDDARTQQSVEALDYWQQPGDITEIPRLGAEVEPTDSDRFLERGDFIRLRNIQLRYELPQGITSKLRMQNISVFLAGTNLATFSGFQGDPEVGVFIEESASTVNGQLPGEFAGFSYPNARSITGGINVRF